MKNYSILLLAALSLAGCAKTTIDITVENAPGASVELRKLDLGTLAEPDTLVLDARGRAKFTADVKTGNPEFFYAYLNGRNIASLLLEQGEKAVVRTDTLGNCSVEGSENSAKLIEAGKAFAAFIAEAEECESQVEYSKLYSSYYRDRVRFVLSNIKSLVVIPVLYEKIAGYFPVFSRNTDAVLFRSVCDSLKTVYPESRYVKALETEVERRERNLEMSYRISGAQEIGFPDLEMSDINGTLRKLSEIDSKLILLHFWTPAENIESMFNIEVLKPLYSEYARKGLEIYSVGIDSDKVRWAACVKAQQLPWINVCDGLGTTSPALAKYNVTSLPSTILISDGAVSAEVIGGEKDLRRVIGKILK